MADDPSNQLRALAERLETEVNQLGLHLEHVAFIPNLHGEGPMMMQAVFLVQPESIAEPEVEKTEEELEFDRQFADIEQGFKMDDRQDEEARIRENLRKMLDGE